MTTPTIENSQVEPADRGMSKCDPVDQPDVDIRQDGLLREDLQEFPRIPSLRRQPLQAIAWLLKAVAGIISVIALFAVAASIPVVNLLAMGYLMEAQGRVSRSGKFRSAFYLLPAASRLVGIAIGTMLWLLPIRFLAAATRDAWLLGPNGTVAWLWTASLATASLLIASHLLLAVSCGGSWWSFVRPLNNIRLLRTRLKSESYLHDAHLAIVEFLAAWHLPHLLWIGLIGFATAYLWLAGPAYFFTILDDLTSRIQVVGFVAGSISLTLVLLWAPFMLAHVAATGNWRAMFEPRTVLRLAGRTPFRWAVATALLLGCSSLPLLYEALFKIRIPPHDARWDIMVVFLVTVVPARILIGWVYHRATQREAREPSWLWRCWQLANGLALCVGVGWYAYFLNLASVGGELGSDAIWQFHAVLLPFPF